MASIRGERRDEPPGPHFLRHSLERRRLRPQGVPSRGAQRCIADPGDVGPLQHGAVLQGAAARIPHSPAAGHAPPAVVGPPLWSQAGADTARAARRCPASRAAGSRMVPEGRCRRPSHPTRQGTRGAGATRDAAPMVAPMAGGGSRSACRGGAPASVLLGATLVHGRGRLRQHGTVPAARSRSLLADLDQQAATRSLDHRLRRARLRRERSRPARADSCQCPGHTRRGLLGWESHFRPATRSVCDVARRDSAGPSRARCRAGAPRVAAHRAGIVGRRDRRRATRRQSRAARFAAVRVVAADRGSAGSRRHCHSANGAR